MYRTRNRQTLHLLLQAANEVKVYSCMLAVTE